MLYCCIHDVQTSFADQLKRLAVQGLIHQFAPQQAYAPVPQVNVHNMISTDAHAAAATEQSNSQESNIVTKVKNTIKQARANLIPLLIGGAAALLLHNHLPILKRKFQALPLSCIVCQCRDSCFS
jgi:hypothetical protein